MQEKLEKIAGEFNKKTQKKLSIRIDGKKLVLPGIVLEEYFKQIEALGHGRIEAENSLANWIRRTSYPDWHRENLEILEKENATPDLITRMQFQVMRAYPLILVRFFGKTRLSPHEMVAWSESIPHIIAASSKMNREICLLEALVKKHVGRNKVVMLQPKVSGGKLDFHVSIIDAPRKRATQKK